MAMWINVNPLKQLIRKRALILNSCYTRVLCDKVVTLEVSKFDVIDNFTSDLIQRTTQKWVNVKLKKSQTSCSLIKSKTLEIKLNLLSQGDLDKQFLHLVNDGTEENIEEFIRQCKRSYVFPTFTHILYLLDSYSRNANINIIMGLKELYDDQGNELYRANGLFDHYLAEAYWLNGEVVKALQVFEEVYTKHQCLRRRIKLMLKYLIMDVTTQSEAILVRIIKFTEKLYKEYGDSFPLGCVWQACFLSEYYSDQKLAMELLERHDGLCDAVVGNLPHVVTTSLRQHQVEVVYRLLELLIKFDMKLQYSAILVSLFNYKYQICDLKSCSEIIQWSVTYNVMLPQLIQERFLMLLLKRKDIKYGRPTKPSETKMDLKF